MRYRKEYIDLEIQILNTNIYIYMRCVWTSFLYIHNYIKMHGADKQTSLIHYWAAIMPILVYILKCILLLYKDKQQ